MQYEMFDIVRLKDGRTGTIVDTCGEAYIVDIGYSVKDFDTIMVEADMIEGITELLSTPFGTVFIFVDDKVYPYKFVTKQPNSRVYPDIVGAYHIEVNYIPDGKDHLIKCVISGIKYEDNASEPGERLECNSFYNDEGWKLSIGLECEFEGYDYESKYLDDGIAFRILADTKTEKYVFGIAWIDNARESENRDVQTWFAVDVTI